MPTSCLTPLYETSINTIANDGVTRNESSVVIRYVDASNFYWMGVGCWGREFSISRMLNGVATEIASYGLESNLQRGVTYTLTGVANSNILTLYVNENQVLQIADSAFCFGAFGIRTFDSSIQTLDVAALTRLICTNKPFIYVDQGQMGNRFRNNIAIIEQSKLVLSR